jgi:hypothetical protein
VPNASGYRIYYGPSPGQYTQSRDVGNSTSADLTGLSSCSTYHVAVKAYSGTGESTGYSNEVSGWARPEIDGTEPGAAMQGSQITLDFTGSNFDSAAQVTVDTGALPTDGAGDPLLRIEDITVLSCDRIQALMTVEPTARGLRAMEVGDLPLDVQVRNPDSVFGTRTVQVEVLFDPFRADINRSNSATRNRADGEDLVWLAHSYGASQGENHFNPDADLDGDGLVDGVDLAYLAARFGQCWNGSVWGMATCP